jgi:hypothetical protein
MPHGVPDSPCGPSPQPDAVRLLWTEGDQIVNPSDYVLWLQGMFDTIGDRTPTPEEWAKLRERHTEMTGEVVMQRVEEAEIVQKEKMRRAQEEEKHQLYLQMQAESLKRYQTAAAQQKEKAVWYGILGSSNKPSLKGPSF